MQADETVDSVCARQSSYIRWGASGSTTAPGETCPYTKAGWSQNVPVCDTVRCGETALFGIRDGGSCEAAPGEWRMRDASNTFNFTCTVAGPGGSPCASCAGAAATDGCRWQWRAPATQQEADFLVAPPPASNNQTCRCTGYKPANASEWLCSKADACPAVPGHRRFRLFAAAQCPAEYTGTRRCWLKSNWKQILELQGLGPGVKSLVVGAGDRTVSLNLKALECACSSWNLTGKPPVVPPP